MGRESSSDWRRDPHCNKSLDPAPLRSARRSILAVLAGLDSILRFLLTKPPPPGVSLARANIPPPHLTDEEPIMAGRPFWHGITSRAGGLLLLGTAAAQ